MTAFVADAPAARDLSMAEGNVVWSQPAPEGWRLMRFNGGIVTMLPAAPRSVPFDADAGTDREGRPVVVFSRCATEPPAPQGLDAPDWSQARGCQVHELSLATGAERTRAERGTTPSEFKGHLAYAAGRPWAQLLLDGRGLSSGALPAGGPAHTSIDRIDLGPHGAAFLSRMTGGSTYGVGPAWELRLAPPDGRTSVLMSAGIVGEECGQSTPMAPVSEPNSVAYLATGVKCTDATQFVSYSLNTGLRATGATPEPAAGFAIEKGTAYWLTLAEPRKLMSSAPTVAGRLQPPGGPPADWRLLPGHRWVAGPLHTMLLRPPERLDCIPRNGGIVITLGSKGGHGTYTHVVGKVIRGGTFPIKLAGCKRKYTIRYRVSRTQHGKGSARSFTVKVY